jgi:hypothetical protein
VPLHAVLGPGGSALRRRTASVNAVIGGGTHCGLSFFRQDWSFDPAQQCGVGV